MWRSRPSPACRLGQAEREAREAVEAVCTRSARGAGVRARACQLRVHAAALPNVFVRFSVWGRRCCPSGRPPRRGAACPPMRARCARRRRWAAGGERSRGFHAAARNPTATAAVAVRLRVRRTPPADTAAGSTELTDSPIGRLIPIPSATPRHSTHGHHGRHGRSAHSAGRNAQRDVPGSEPRRVLASYPPSPHAKFAPPALLACVEHGAHGSRARTSERAWTARAATPSPVGRPRMESLSRPSRAPPCTARRPSLEVCGPSSTPARQPKPRRPC